MIKLKIIEQYLSHGKNLTLLNGKRPMLKDWTERTLTLEEITSHKGNLGWVLGGNDFVVDVDPKNGGKASFKKLLADLKEIDSDIDLSPTVSTPSGGVHIYLSIPEGERDNSFRKTLNNDYPGIDFLTKGTQCVIVGSTTEKGSYEWADDLFGEFVQLEAPQVLLDRVKTDRASLPTSRGSGRDMDDLGDFEGLVGGGSANWSEDDVLDMLDKLDPSMTNDDWVKVGMALHDWDPVAGLDFWEKWSRGGDNYKEGETSARWKSFGLGGGVTLGTVAYMAREVDYDETSSLISGYLNRIKMSDEKQLEFDLMPKLKKEKLSKINKEKLVKALQDRYKELTDVRMPIGNLRQMISNVDVVTGTFVDNEERPEWCNNWVYVNSHQGFMKLDTLVLHKAESFNLENGKYVPMTEGGTKPGASKYVADRGFIDKVDAMAYLPSFDELICTIDGNRVLNSFNPKTVPLEAEELTEAGREAIGLIEKHIKFICSSDENAAIFTQWLAHQVQYPGRQILWSPVIQAIQGVGKSFFGELLRACLGDRNVGTVSPTQVTSDFNGWATGVVVNVLEELRVKGHNRFDAVNALKPLITDRMIQINDKGIKQYMTYNTTNYMCFTNYKDSLPLDGDDRRWWVIFAQIESLSQLPEFVGEEAVTYFPKLFDAVREQGAQIRRWLLDYPITDEFMAIKQAPMTEYKLSMIAIEDSSFEGFQEVKEEIEKGGPYWNVDCVCSSDLFNYIAMEYPNLELSNFMKHNILKKLGYSQQAKVVKIDNKSRRVWTKRPLDNDQVRDALTGKNTEEDYLFDDI